MYRELINLTKFIPHSKFWALNRIKHVLKNPILDLGCHVGETFYYMKFRGNIIGVDINSDYFDECRKRGIYQELIEMDLLNIPENLDYFGSVTAFFVLEHLKKQDGLNLLDKMKNLGENNIILVPYGFIAQDSPDGNPFQRHVSSWMPNDFLKRNFQVSICRTISMIEFPCYKVILGVRNNEKN